MFCHKLLPTWLVCVICSLPQKSCWICFQLLCVSHCSRGSFYYRLNTWDVKFTCIRTDTCRKGIISVSYVCIYHTQSYICISMHMDPQCLRDRRVRWKCCDATKHSVFGHDYCSLFIPAAAYDKVIHLVTILLRSLKLLISSNTKPVTSKATGSERGGGDDDSGYTKILWKPIWNKKLTTLH